MKKIIVLIIICVITFIIYMTFKDDKLYYVYIGDNYIDSVYTYNDYIYDYLDEIDKLENHVILTGENKRLVDLKRDIMDNVTYNGKTIKNILIKSDFLLLSLGYNDIYKNLNKNNRYEIKKLIDTYIKDLSDYLSELRKATKEEIVMLNFMNIFGPSYNDVIAYLNEEINNLCEKYKIGYIDISDIDVDLSAIEIHHEIFERVRQRIDSNIKNK